MTAGLPRQTERKGHFAAIPYKDVPAFIKKLRASDAGEPVRLAFELLILTAARTGELLHARWNEIDLKAAVWTIPAERMKAGYEHRVPLSRRAIEILKRARVLAMDGDYLFPGRGGDRPMSGMVFLMALRRMGEEFTAHGFRSGVPRLGGGADQLPDRGLRDGPRPYRPQQGRGRLPARRPLRQAARADGSVGQFRPGVSSAGLSNKNPRSGLHRPRNPTNYAAPEGNPCLQLDRRIVR
ncbi:MAG: site-specific integrase [Bauldia sp.]